MFHIGLNYNYRFIIKKLAEKFKEQFRSSGQNTEKSIFSVPIDWSKWKKNYKNHILQLIAY